MTISYSDPLYDLVEFDEAMSRLALTPMIQRLRHVRLSNIDSLDSPGISGITRYEHVLGVAFLAAQMPLLRFLSTVDQKTVIGAAMLHDWAITAYGHLVEEAFQYTGDSFAHETKLLDIIHGESRDVGGIGMQVLWGRGTGLQKWAADIADARSDETIILDNLTSYIRGTGRFGGLIASDIDLDNLDNVFRVAYHIGLRADFKTPLRVAHSISQVNEENGRAIFPEMAMADIELWLSVRRRVYTCLMLGRKDFAGKLMLLSSTVKAILAGEISASDWSMTDGQYIDKLLASRTPGVADQVVRWQCGELWELAPLMWIKGSRPAFPDLLKFSEQLSGESGRECFAYGIKDKRDRELQVCIEGRIEILGHQSDSWLLGIGSSTRKPVTKRDEALFLDSAQAMFGDVVSVHFATEPAASAQPWLF